MNEMSDQNNLENQLVRALQKEPQTSLPMGFAARVTRTVFTPKPRPLSHSVIALFCGLLVSILSCLTLFFIKPSLAYHVFHLLNTGKYVILTVIAGLLMIQYLERQLPRTV